MTDEWDTEIPETDNNFQAPSLADEIAEVESTNIPQQSTVNPMDEEADFIYDEETNRLTCVGTQYSEIPQNIGDTYADRTKILDLSKNRFRSLDFLKQFPDLEELILDENDLDDLHTIFPKLNHLKILMLNKNRLQDIYKLVDQLHTAFPILEHLSLLGNEACPYQIIPTTNSSKTDFDSNIYAQDRADEEYKRYRHLLIFRIPTLKFLDASEISPNERQVATQLGDILYTIAETKQIQSERDEKKPEKKRFLYSITDLFGRYEKSNTNEKKNA